MMKSQIDTKRSRNARLNQAGTHASILAALIDELPMKVRAGHIENDEFWSRGRALVNQICQCFHEANGYNNVMKASATVTPAAAQEENATA